MRVGSRRRRETIEAPPVVVTLEPRRIANLWFWPVQLFLAVFGDWLTGGELRFDVVVRDAVSNQVIYQNGPYTWDVARSLANDLALAVNEHGTDGAVCRIKTRLGARLSEADPTLAMNIHTSFRGPLAVCAAPSIS